MQWSMRDVRLLPTSAAGRVQRELMGQWPRIVGVRVDTSADLCIPCNGTAGVSVFGNGVVPKSGRASDAG